MFSLLGCDLDPAASGPFTITFDTQGGEEMDSEEVEGITSFNLPQTVKEGHTFLGWVVKGDLTERLRKNVVRIDSDTTLVAQWRVNQYTVTFETDGGEPIGPLSLDYGSDLGLHVPIKEGYVFTGWHLDEQLTFTIETVSAEDIVIHAGWALETYAITYNIDGGANHPDNQSFYTIETDTLFFEAPTKEGHTFMGWYDNEVFTGPEMTSLGQGSIGDVELFAKWEVNQYHIQYFIFDEVDSDVIIPLMPGETIVQSLMGGYHSSALTSEGRLFMWGYNYYGQLGDSTTTSRNTPTEITSHFDLAGSETITQVTLGTYHSSALTSEGRLFMWGNNEYGQLGDGTTIWRNAPTEINNHFLLLLDETVIQVSLGFAHSSALTSEGRLFMWGYNAVGELGDGTIMSRHTPVEISDQFNLNEGENIFQVSLAYLRSSALTSEGRLFMWGINSYGQLGDGTTINRSTPTDITDSFEISTDDMIVLVSLGGYHSSALTSKGNLFVWGWNAHGQLGDGTNTNRTTPTEITSHFDLSNDDTLIQVTLGQVYSSALTSKGRLLMWGNNGVGQLGDGTTMNRSTPTDITGVLALPTDETTTHVSFGESHSSALTSKGRLFVWGGNSFGQLGDGTTTQRETPFNLFYSPFEIIHETTYDFNDTIIPFMPARDGYDFSGWHVDCELTTPFDTTVMPAENIILYGTWIPNGD